MRIINPVCDYSLLGITNRLAVPDEELVIYQFPTGSLGMGPPMHSGLWSSVKAMLSPPPPPPLVVCIPPGARLWLRDIPFSLQVELGMGREEEVGFVQVTGAENRYRDAVKFANGEEVLLQRLARGQRVRVLSLQPAEECGPAAQQPAASECHS